MGIVSREWWGLLIVWLDRYEVQSISGSRLFYILNTNGTPPCLLYPRISLLRISRRATFDSRPREAGTKNNGFLCGKCSSLRKENSAGAILSGRQTLLEQPHFTSPWNNILESLSSGVLELRRSNLICGKSSPKRNLWLKRTQTDAIFKQYSV
jgi:hypothetical protein